MPKSENQKKIKRAKNIKNIYVNKINSLCKVTGDKYSSFQCLQVNFYYRSNVRRAISSQSRQALMFQRKENNKDAARKARLRKKIYMQLLQQAVENLQKLNQQSKQLQKTSNQLLQNLNKQFQKQDKKYDQIDRYLIAISDEKVKKQYSQVTIDMQKQCQLNRIAVQIQKIAMPSLEYLNRLTIKASQAKRFVQKIKVVQQYLPELYAEIKSLCSDHTSLLVQAFSSKCNQIVDPYICKTLMEKYYSQTICRKDIVKTQAYKYLTSLSKIQKHCFRIVDE